MIVNWYNSQYNWFLVKNVVENLWLKDSLSIRLFVKEAKLHLISIINSHRSNLINNSYLNQAEPNNKPPNQIKWSKIPWLKMDKKHHKHIISNLYPARSVGEDFFKIESPNIKSAVKENRPLQIIIIKLKQSQLWNKKHLKNNQYRTYNLNLLLLKNQL